ncbi:hypothetical protein [Traorella massiliensis]|uniref:hypothetical protein n=1 Tax=Traorella massiliensis TaxID=1903263 RepID=UPI00248D5CEA|nr:hypothetical protein [Traorella massiliensis]
MNKTSASVFLAIILDLIFAFLFLVLLSQWKGGEEEITLHMNQIGMFKETTNSMACIEKLEGLGYEAFSYTKDDLIIVVTSLSLNEEETLEAQKVLSENQISYILKKVTSTGKQFNEAVTKGDMKLVMELMSD